MRPAACLALAALAAAIAGCGLLRVGPSPTPTVVTHTDPYPANPTGAWDSVLVVVTTEHSGPPEVSVGEAVRREGGDEPLLVQGALFVDDAYGQVWLCGRVQHGGDSGAPECGGTILLVQTESAGAGLLASQYIAALLAAGSVNDLQRAGTVRWSADASFLGRIR